MKAKTGMKMKTSWIELMMRSVIEKMTLMVMRTIRVFKEKKKTELKLNK